MVEMQSVTSSNIDQIGYDKENNELHVRFKNGSLYIYEGVNEDHFVSMTTAESVGKYLNQHIKDVHSFKRVE